MALVALPLTSAVLARPQVAPAPAAPPAKTTARPDSGDDDGSNDGPTTAAPLLADGAIRVEAPVTAATVYSERARVARSARLTLSSPQSRLRFPPLCGQVDPASLRVDVQGYGAGGRGHRGRGRADRIERPLIGDLAQSTAQLPIAEVDRLVRAIEAIDDEHARLEEERGALPGSPRPAVVARSGCAADSEYVKSRQPAQPRRLGGRFGLRPGATGHARGSRAVHRRS